MNNLDTRKLDTLRKEHEYLRTELQQLKSCQLQYFTLSVTGTGALFALASTIESNQGLRALLFLAPLILIFPCWWIFFDKATTITRIVGYYRILEEMINDYPNPRYPFWGYENALAYYRDKDNENTWNKFKEIRDNASGANTIKPKFTRHRFWTINFWTYAALSFLCICTSFAVSTSNKVALTLSLVSFGFFIFSFINNYKLLSELRSGDFSYSVITDFWRYILRSSHAQLGTTMDENIQEPAAEVSTPGGQVEPSGGGPASASTPECGEQSIFEGHCGGPMKEICSN